MAQLQLSPQELGAQLQVAGRVAALHQLGRRVACRAQPARGARREARAEAALLRQELLQAEDAHAPPSRPGVCGGRHRASSKIGGGTPRSSARTAVWRQLRRRMREADEQEAARLQQAALMRRELAQAERRSPSATTRARSCARRPPSATTRAHSCANYWSTCAAPTSAPTATRRRSRGSPSSRRRRAGAAREPERDRRAQALDAAAARPQATG